MPFENNIVVWIIVTVAAVILLLALLALVIYRFAYNSFRSTFARPEPRPPYDKSPLSIPQDTIFGRGQNWFYSNRMDFMNVQMTTFDGIKLFAYYRPAQKSTTTDVVILLHGWRDQPSIMAAYAELHLEKHDCHILIPHMRAHGMSQGKFIGYGLFDSQDVILWMQYLERHLKAPLRIVLHGRSMGAATALMVAGSGKAPSSLAGVIADSSFDSLESEMMHLMKKRLGFRSRAFLMLVSRIARRKIHFPVEQASPAQFASRIRVPVLLFHGTDDHFIPLEMSENIYNRITAPKRYVQIEGAKHVMSYHVAPSRYSEEVGKFLSILTEKKTIFPMSDC